MKVFRFMSPEEAAAVLTGSPLENRTDHTSYARTESRGFCFFPYVQHVWGYGEKDGWYGRHYATVGIREAEGFFSFRPTRSVLCLVLDIPKGSLKESHGRYNLEDVLRLEYHGEPSVFIDYKPVTGTLREYCCETYPEGYSVLAAYSSAQIERYRRGFLGLPKGLNAGGRRRKVQSGDQAAIDNAVDILRCIQRYLERADASNEDELSAAESELLQETRLALDRIGAFTA